MRFINWIILRLFRLGNRIWLKKAYSKKELFTCKCGLNYYVYYNLYGSCSGGGHCECGGRTIIN